MPFNTSLCHMLEQYTNNPPSNHEDWSAPWTQILFTLFPFAADYMTFPQRRRASKDLIIEVAKISTPPTRRTVLILDLNSKDSRDFERGKDVVMQNIERKAQKAFERTAVEKVYWIGAIGPNWRYGEKEDGQDLAPLIEWHHVAHDEASYQDFLQLVNLVATLDVSQPGIWHMYADD